MTTPCPTRPATPVTTDRRRPPGRAVTLALNVVAPVAAFYVLHTLGWSDVPTLSTAAVFPLAGCALTALRTRRLDAIGAVTAVGLVGGIVTTLLTHDARILVGLNALPNVVIGVMFLASLLGGRTLIEQMAGQVSSHNPAGAAAQRRFRRLTRVWGVALLLSAMVHIAVAVLLPLSIAVAAAPAASAIVLAPTGLWTMWTGARTRRPRHAA